MLNLNSSVVQNLIAQVAHLFSAYSAIFTVLVFCGPRVGLTVTILAVIVAAVKEFYYDAHYEIPFQAAADNVEDFAVYVLGMTLGWAAYFVS